MQNNALSNAARSTPGRLAPIAALVAAAVAAVALVGCGGGGGGSAASNSGGQATTAATYSGAVSGLGSIVVNGVRFSTSNARATDAESDDSYQRAFALGTTVTVAGNVDDNSASATATAVVVHGGVRGAVTAVDTAANTLTLAGQTIKVDANTVFEGLNSASLTLAGLKTAVDTANATVTTADTVYAEVHVLGDATSGFLATRVEQKSAIAEGHAVVGKVATGSLDSTAKTFRLLLRNGVTVNVDYSSASLRPAGVTLTEGTAVRVVSGTNPSTLNNNDTLTATKLIVKRDRAITGRAKLRGAVSAVSGNSVTINDVVVDVSQARFEDGLTLASLTVGTVVKVDGTLTNGVLVAREVEADGREYNVANGGGVKLYGVVTNATAGTPATFSIQGVTLTLPAGASLPANGRYVEVIARLVSGVLTVVRLENEDNRGQRSFEVYGTTPCTAGSSDLMATFTLTQRNGSTTSVDGRSAVIELEDRVNMSSGLTGAECFVEVKGAVTSTNTVTATRIEVKARGVVAN